MGTTVVDEQNKKKSSYTLPCVVCRGGQSAFLDSGWPAGKSLLSPRVYWMYLGQSVFLSITLQGLSGGYNEITHPVHAALALSCLGKNMRTWEREREMNDILLRNHILCFLQTESVLQAAPTSWLHGGKMFTGGHSLAKHFCKEISHPFVGWIMFKTTLASSGVGELSRGPAQQFSLGCSNVSLPGFAQPWAPLPPTDAQKGESLLLVFC